MTVTRHLTRALVPLFAIVGGMIGTEGAPQPVGAWDFTSQAEAIRDQSGHGNDLRVEGCDWVPSKLGRALRVPSTTARIWREKPGGALRPAQALGVIAWVRPLGTGQYCAVVRQGK